MIKISKRDIDFSPEIYTLGQCIYITTDKFWDGGYSNDASLTEKCEFYKLASIFSKTLREIITILNDKVIISESCCQTGRYFEKWKDKSKYESYKTLKHFIKKCCLLEFPSDNIIIDYIIENNFRYLSCIDIYLEFNQVVFQPTCHSEIIMYIGDEKKYSDIKDSVEEIINMNQLILKQDRIIL